MEVPLAIQSILNFKHPKMLSKIYKTLANSDCSVPVDKWNRDLSLQPNSNFLRTICLSAFSKIKQLNLQLIHFEVLQRTNFTGQQMFQMGMTTCQTCSHCIANEIDNYMHALWYCSPVYKFWHMKCNVLLMHVGHTITATAFFCLVGDLSNIAPYKAEPSMLITSLPIAKKRNPRELEN